MGPRDMRGKLNDITWNHIGFLIITTGGHGGGGVPLQNKLDMTSLPLPLGAGDPTVSEPRFSHLKAPPTPFL